ncbi:MAG: isopeptide-forming domain-containing fimbrial protein [Candidatus Saccharimonadales bacterium]
MKTKKTTFKRLVSNLPYNPSLINQVAFYGKRLRQETSIRRLGFVFVGLTLLVQMFAVIAPPTPSLAQDPNNDIIAGGFDNRDQAVLMCLDGNRDFGTILSHYDINCDNIAAATTEVIQSTNDDRKIRSVGRLPYGFSDEQAENIPGARGTIYSRYLWDWDSGTPSTYKVLQGLSVTGRTFYILFDCGNLSLIEQPPVVPPPVTPPPVTPEPFADCSILLINHDSGSSVKKNTEIVLRGQVTGGNLPAGTTADLSYEYVNADTGAAMAPAIPANGILFKDGVALDPSNRSFVVKTPGKYEFRLAATYSGGKEVRGSRQGKCISTIYVETPPETCTTSCLEYDKKASNDTKNIPNADGTTASAGDVITYTLSAKNTGKATVKQFVIIENISDILDYADITDLHGGSIDKENFVRWPASDIKAGETLSKQFTVKVKNPIPQTPVSTSNPGKFDLTMTNVYEKKTVTIKLPPSVIKTTEQVTTTLPNTGPGANMLIAFALTSMVAYFFYRSRLLNKELNLVIQETTTGA